MKLLLFKTKKALSLYYSHNVRLSPDVSFEGIEQSDKETQFGQFVNVANKPT